MTSTKITNDLVNQIAIDTKREGDTDALSTIKKNIKKVMLDKAANDITPFSFSHNDSTKQQVEAARLRVKLKPGYGVSVDRGYLRHYGVYIGDGKIVELQFAEDGMWKKINKSRIVDLPTFLKQQKASDTEIIKPKSGNVQDIIKRAIKVTELKYVPYHLIYNNCEHLMNEILTGEHKSHQVDEIVPAKILKNKYSHYKKFYRDVFESQRD